jgi:hypothetical protein
MAHFCGKVATQTYTVLYKPPKWLIRCSRLARLCRSLHLATNVMRRQGPVEHLGVLEVAREVGSVVAAARLTVTWARAAVVDQARRRAPALLVLEDRQVGAEEGRMGRWGWMLKPVGGGGEARKGGIWSTYTILSLGDEVQA